MSGGVRVEVHLLDGRKLEFSVGARLLTQDLMSLVTSHFSLREHHYFSLAFKDPTGHYHWLLDDRRLLDHDFARGLRLLPLHFLVRFYPENAMELRDPQTVELFYQHAKNLVASGELPVDDSTSSRLAALSLHTQIGDSTEDSSAKNCFAKSFINENLRKLSEERFCGEHQQLIGLSRGDAILSYMRQIESIPGYGVHFYEVRDRSNSPWHLGISQKGISQYDYCDKRKPNRVFYWKQLENLYFRERKFSIEVHDPKRVVTALNAFNLYEGAIHEGEIQDSLYLRDDLLHAITEDTTQVSVTRRAFGPGNVSIFVWFAENQSLCKVIWSMAIAQHQFYLDRKTSRTKEGLLCRELPDLAGELSKSCVSLSTHSSSPNISRSGSHSSLQHHSHTEESVSTESLHLARMEMLTALQRRYDALKKKLEEKTEELRLLCLREGELCGEMPLDYPRKPGEALPVVRKRVGTSFSLDEALINKIINKQGETVSSLELEYEIQAKIATAALRLANESSSRKGLRKQRKQSYQQASQRLRDIEEKLWEARSKQAQVIAANNASTMPKMKKKPRPISDGEGLSEDSIPNAPLNSPNCPKETSFMNGVPLSPTGSSSNYSYSHLQQRTSSVNMNGSICQRNHPGRGLSSDISSGQLRGSDESAPICPPSGYIPSGVYTKNQYRAQNYPTLSTRGQSVPSKTLQPQRSFNGGLYNLPEQRTSLASHSLDDLDTPNPNSPIINSTPPPHPNSHYGGYPGLPTKPPLLQPQRERTDSNDRYGSLDRRRTSSGRFESRSMEHLDSFPPSISPSPVQPPVVGANHAYHSPYHDLPIPEVPMKIPPVSLHAASQNYKKLLDNSSDMVDGFQNSVKHMTSYLQPIISDNQYQNTILQNYELNKIQIKAVPMEQNGFTFVYNGTSPNQENIPPMSKQSHAEVLLPLRATESRDRYSTHLRTTASVNAADHRHFIVPASGLQPLRPTKSSSELMPLQPTESGVELIPLQTSSGKSNYQISNCHPLKSCSELVPLRPVRSSPSPQIKPQPELPPLKCTSEALNSLVGIPCPPTNMISDLPPSLRLLNGRMDTPSPNSHNKIESKYIDGTPEWCPKQDLKYVNSEEAVTELNALPLMSLAEGARMKKEWFGNENFTPNLGNDAPMKRELFGNENVAAPNPGSDSPMGNLESKPNPHSSLNMSTSSIGSSGSNGSVFHSANDGNESLNISLNTTLNASLNATLTIISPGSYQPSREVSKPFEMSDFYKYSTKFRRKSSSGGGHQMNGPPDGATTGGIDSDLSKLPLLAAASSSNASLVSLTSPPSPTTVANNSSPAPQQKGVYRPLSPLTCKGLDNEDGSSPKACWDNAPILQAVPVTVTTKRSATLV